MVQYKKGEMIAGTYRVERVFGGEGKSGMGVVYLVSSHDSPNPFVLKTIHFRRSEEKIGRSQNQALMIEMKDNP